MPNFKLNVMPKQPLRDVLVILGCAVLITLLAFAFGWDETIAAAIYDPHNKIAWWIRQKSLLPGLVASVVALVFLMAWPLRLKHPVLRRMAVVWLVAFIIGGGVINQVLVKETVQRPRPRETVLLGGQVDAQHTLFQRAALKGKSFPSGHVVVGIMFAVPFFVWRRRRPKMAMAFLAGGIAYATVIGGARMVLGAHYLTDVVWGAAITLATAAVAAHFFKENQDFPNKITVPFLVVAILLVAWFNKFTMALMVHPQGSHVTFKAPCSKMTHAYGDVFEISIKLTGYGAPLSLLQLNESNKGVIYLQRYLGLYRGLDCVGHIVLSPKSSACFIEKEPNATFFSKPAFMTCVSREAKK